MIYLMKIAKKFQIMKDFELNNSLFIDNNSNKKILDNFMSFSINQTKTLQVIRECI